MRTIKDFDELKMNLDLFEYYLCEGSDYERYSVGKFIARGKCFVSYKKGDEWRFVPSRFVGYFNNDLEKHSNNAEKDGKETNPAINKIANSRLEESMDLEQKYLEYCHYKGIKSSNNVRKYWTFQI